MTQALYLDAGQGDGEERPQAYLNTLRTYRSQATQQCAKSLGKAAGFASSQAKAVRSLR